MIDTTKVEGVISALQALLESDGARLVLREVDPSMSRITVELDVSSAGCVECVLPSPVLESIVCSELEMVLGEEFELLLLDSRPVDAEQVQGVLPDD